MEEAKRVATTSTNYLLFASHCDRHPVEELHQTESSFEDMSDLVPNSELRLSRCDKKILTLRTKSKYQKESYVGVNSLAQREQRCIDIALGVQVVNVNIKKKKHETNRGQGGENRMSPY